MPPAAPVLGAHVRKSLEIAAVRPAFALGLRAATATIAPLVVGDASGQPIFGWMALGGWLCAIADPGGPHLLRARTMAAFAAAAALVTGLGTVASTSPSLSVAVLFAGAVAASLARVGGEAAGTVGTMALILLCIALGSPAPPELAMPRVTMALGGCAISTALALLLWPVHAYRPARLAIASCYRELAALAASIAEPSDDRERAWSDLVLQQPPRVRAELERARVALGGALRDGRRVAPRLDHGRRGARRGAFPGRELVALRRGGAARDRRRHRGQGQSARPLPAGAPARRTARGRACPRAPDRHPRAGDPRRRGAAHRRSPRGGRRDPGDGRAPHHGARRAGAGFRAAPPRRPDGGHGLDRCRHRRLAGGDTRFLGDRGGGDRPAARYGRHRPARGAASPRHGRWGRRGRAAAARPAQSDAHRHRPLPPLRARARAAAAQLRPLHLARHARVLAHGRGA